MADAIKIPRKVYVGFQGRRTEDEVPLGFMTPYGEDAAGVKRRATVDSWAKNAGYGRNKTFNSVTIENKPMVGFKIGRSVRRSSGWNGNGATYFRIEDPRGFELEITVDNLVMISSICILERGEIMQECVWGRDGQRNILIPTNSEPFHEAVDLPDDDEKVDMKSLKRGDRVRLVSGEYGVWMGTMTPIMSKSSDLIPTAGSRKQTVRVENKDGRIQYKMFSNATVVKVLEKVAQDLTDAELDSMVAKDLISDPFCCSYQVSYDVGSSVALISSGKKLQIGAEYHEAISAGDLRKMVNDLKDVSHYRELEIEVTLGTGVGYTERGQFAENAYHYDQNRSYTQNPPGTIAVSTSKRSAHSYPYASLGLVNPEDVTQFRLKKRKLTSYTGVEIITTL